jgi:hypothetical protein
MKIDRLFLVKNCPECSVVKAALNFEAVEQDGFLGRNGQRFFVFNALSNDACRELLDKYGLKDKFAPTLLTDEGATIIEPGHIVDYLRRNGMA